MSIRWLQMFGGGLVLLAGGWLVTAHLLGLQLLAVQTGSMCPTFCPGDAVVMRRLSARSLRVGMVVSYRGNRNPNQLVTHRLLSLSRDEARTKGDALVVVDPPLRPSALVGQVVATLPVFGRALDFVRSWPGLVCCVYLPVAGIVYGELRRLERSTKRRRPYQLIR
jgi:signal peptidase I